MSVVQNCQLQALAVKYINMEENLDSILCFEGGHIYECSAVYRIINLMH